MSTHQHQLQREPGRITCACGLDVPRPPGMPDYRRATMAGWSVRSRRA